MRSIFMLRSVVVLLVSLNLSYWLWNAGDLRLLGLEPKSVQEPSRLDSQVAPELLVMKATQPENK
jgi:hypothetical protein